MILLIISLFQIALAIVVGTISAIMANRDAFVFIAIFTALYMGTGLLGLRVAMTALNKVPFMIFNSGNMLLFGVLIYIAIGSIIFLGIPFLLSLVSIICTPRSKKIDLSLKIADSNTRGIWLWKALDKLKFNKQSVDTFYTSMAALVFAAMMSMAIWCAKENGPVNVAYQNMPFACCYLLGLVLLVLFTISGWYKFSKEHFGSKNNLIVVNLLLLLIASGIALRGLCLMFLGISSM